MRVMISQAMAGKTDEEIAKNRGFAEHWLDALGYEIVDTLFDFDAEYLSMELVENEPLYYLAKSIEAMSKCEMVYFCAGWENARGCRLEHAAAEAYGLKIVHEEELSTFSFAEAIDYVKRGWKVARKGWNGKRQYIQLATGISYRTADGEVVNCEHAAIGNKAIAFVGTSGVQMGWLASQADMLAEDWVLVCE